MMDNNKMNKYFDFFVFISVKHWVLEEETKKRKDCELEEHQQQQDDDNDEEGKTTFYLRDPRDR